MSSHALRVLIACGVLGIALAAGIKREAIGDFIRFEIDAQEAAERGDEDLRQNPRRSGHLSPRHDNRLHVR